MFRVSIATFSFIQSLLQHLHPDMTLMVEALIVIVSACNRKMHSRVVEVMYTALHPWGPQIQHRNAKQQDVKESLHDYRILTYLRQAGQEAEERREAFYLNTRAERSFTFSCWSRMDKGLSTQIRIEWDCHSSHESVGELKRMVEEGKDVLPVDAYLRIVRLQQDDSIKIKYEETRETRTQRPTQK